MAVEKKNLGNPPDITSRPSNTTSYNGKASATKSTNSQSQAKPAVIRIQAPQAKPSEASRNNLPADALGRSQVKSEASNQTNSKEMKLNASTTGANANAGEAATVPSRPMPTPVLKSNTGDTQSIQSRSDLSLEGSKGRMTFKPGNILVLVGFTDQSNFIDFNSDKIGDISHGHLVKMFLENQGVPADKITLINKGANGEAMDRVGSQLQQISQNIKENNGFLTQDLNGKPMNPTHISAINFSQSTFTTLQDVQTTLGLSDLTPENLTAKREDIRNKLASFAKENPDHQYAQFQAGVEAIDTLHSLGIKVYVAAGKQCHNDFNLFSLGNEAISVGATKPSPLGENNQTATGPIKWTESETWGTADNSLIRRYEQGYYPIREIKGDAPQPLGFDFTGDSKVDIPFNQVFDPNVHGKLLQHFGIEPVYLPPDKRAFRGTSFAVPTALGQDWVDYFKTQSN